VVAADDAPPLLPRGPEADDVAARVGAGAGRISTLGSACSVAPADWLADGMDGVSKLREDSAPALAAAPGTTPWRLGELFGSYN
jgi:hypothetical protein